MNARSATRGGCARSWPSTRSSRPPDWCRCFANAASTCPPPRSAAWSPAPRNVCRCRSWPRSATSCPAPRPGPRRPYAGQLSGMRPGGRGPGVPDADRALGAGRGHDGERRALLPRAAGVTVGGDEDFEFLAECGAGGHVTVRAVVTLYRQCGTIGMRSMAAASQKYLAQHASFERAFASGDLRKRDHFRRSRRTLTDEHL